MEGAQPGTFVKICGITRVDDAREAIRAGATAVGFVFAPSPRRITAGRAREIVSAVHPSVRRIGVMVDPDIGEVQEVVAEAGLDGVQLQGSESPEMVEEIRGRDPSLFIVKALRVRSPDDVASIGEWSSDAVFLDTKDPSEPEEARGPIPLEWLQGIDLGCTVVSGGLTPSNVGGLVSRLRPWGVDVSSGVEESPGLKNPAKVRSFLKEVRKAEGISRHPCLR